jgi:hypothetical protein
MTPRSTRGSTAGCGSSAMPRSSAPVRCYEGKSGQRAERPTKPEPRNAGLRTLTHNITLEIDTDNIRRLSSGAPESGNLKRPVFVNLSRSRVRVCIRLLTRANSLREDRPHNPQISPAAFPQASNGVPEAENAPAIPGPRSGTGPNSGSCKREARG